MPADLLAPSQIWFGQCSCLTLCKVTPLGANATGLEAITLVPASQSYPLKLSVASNIDCLKVSGKKADGFCSFYYLLSANSS